MPFIPKKRQTHHSYDENVEEPSKLIDDEAVAIETETPSEENEPVEDSAKRNEQESTSFEEE
jgi:hypothetical protein